MLIVQNHLLNSVSGSSQKPESIDQLHFSLRFIQLLRLVSTFIVQYSLPIKVQIFEADFKVHLIYNLLINLQHQLILYGVNFYRVGLQLLIKENPSSSIPLYEKEFFLTQTTRGSSSPQTISIIDVSKLGYQPLQQDINETVPDWIVSSKCNNLFDKSTNFNLTTKSHFFPPRSSALKTTTIPKLVIKTNFTKSYRSGKPDMDSSAFAIFSSRLKFQLKKKNGCKKTQKDGYGFQIFYQNQGINLSKCIKRQIFFLQPCYKLSLSSLEHTENQKNSWCKNPLLKFKVHHYEKCAQVFEVQDFIVEDFNHYTQNELSVVNEKMKIKYKGYIYLHGKEIKKQIKSPILAYNYKIVRKKSNFSLKNGILRTRYSEFNCLLEAASRNWIFTIQKNPFGRITLLVYYTI